MDNYLSHRWPEGQEPAGSPCPQPPEKKRRLWRDILIAVVALGVIAGLLIGGYFGLRYGIRQGILNGILHTEPSFGREDEPVTPPEAATWSPEDLPRGACDSHTEILLTGKESLEVLSAGEIYEKVLPCVVCVQASDGVKYSVGSGVVISQSGYILTNYHVLEGSTELTVMRLDSYELFDAGLVGWDQELDLAILKVEGVDFVPAVLGDSDDLTVGDTVYAIGNPMGYLYGTMTDGIVSAVTERVEDLDYPGRLIQTTAALNSGNSGGALVDAYGRVVGITSAKITGIRGNIVTEGLGLAIPITDVHGYLTRILHTGHSARPAIGIMGRRETDNGITGVRVASVIENSPADGVLEEMDLIIRAGGVRVTSIDELTRLLSWAEQGESMELMVIRGGQILTVSVELYDRITSG